MKNVRIEGTRELIDKLSRTAEDVKKASRRANIAGAEVVAKELERNVPRSGYSGKNPQPKMINNVVISGNRTNKDAGGEYYVAVGFPRGVAHRVHLPEFGSIDQAPQFYFTRTIQNSQRAVQQAMTAEIMRVLK